VSLITDNDVAEVEFTIVGKTFTFATDNELLENTFAQFMVTVLFANGNVNEEAFITVHLLKPLV